MSNTEINQSEHIKRYTEIFSKSNISADEITAFIRFEHQHRFHTDEQHSESYIKLFTLIRDRIIIPNGGKLNLVGLFEELLILLRKSGLSLPPHPEADKLVTALINSMSENEYYWKFRALQMAVIVKTFNGDDWRDTYIRMLFSIPSATCFKSMNDAQQQAKVLRSLFSSCGELMECAERSFFAADFFSKSMLEQKSGFMWILELVWNIVFKESPEHMKIIPCWFRLFEEALDKADKELVFYMHNPLSHIYLNMCHTQEEFKVFNERVEMPLSKYIQKNMRRWGFKPVKKKLPVSGTRRVAFVFDRIVGNSPVKLLISLLTYLKHDENIELFVYDMGYVEKAPSDPVFVNEIKALGITYINNHDLIDDQDHGHHYSHFNKVVKLREQAVSDDIDTLVMTGNRMPSGFLFATRTAPLQVYWDHGNHEYDVKNIDKRICHFDDEYRNPFEFEFFKLKMLDKYLKEEVRENSRKAADIKRRLPEHKIVLGSIGRLMKLSQEYLNVVSEVMHNNPDTIYLACGSGNTQELREKAEGAGIDMKRFIITGWIDPQIYGYVIDIYLNSFPLYGGESVNEFRAKGDDKYVVGLRKG